MTKSRPVGMAVKSLYWFLLCFCIKDVTCFCNITCTTDFQDYLECACSGVSPPGSVLLEANCSYNKVEASGRCEVHPPRSSCQIKPDNFLNVVSLTTKCTVVASDPHEPLAARGESTSWVLGKIVKTHPPFNVNVTRTMEGFNITWEIDNYMFNCLQYRVRLRDPTKPVGSFEETNQYFLMDSINLLPNTCYQADVQAILCPESSPFLGPWSAWSPTVEYSKTDVLYVSETSWVLYVSIAAFICLIGLGYLSKPFCLKKVQFIRFIPDPTLFFKPLHHKYDGQCKDWVHPMFSEAEVLMVVPMPDPVSNHKIFLCDRHSERGEQGEKDEEGRYDDREGEEGEPIDPDGRTLSGHLSLHMVVLSGDEGDPELHGGAGPGEAEPGEMGGGEAGLPARGAEEGGPGELLGSPGPPSSAPRAGSTSERAPPLTVQPDPPRWSEPWDDDYPCVDLDTVDSGFKESDCSSPICLEAASEEEPGGPGLFTQEGSCKSDYVRQWMMAQPHPPPPPPPPEP